MLYPGFNILPRSVFWSADLNGRSDNTDVIHSRETNISDSRFKIDPYDPEQLIGTLDVPFANGQYEFTIILEEGETDITDRQARIVDTILGIDEGFRSAMDEAAFRYFQVVDCPDAILKRENVRENYGEFWFVVPPLNDSQHDYFFINGGCTWEEEHGISFGVKNNQIVLCCIFDGIQSGNDLEDALRR